MTRALASPSGSGRTRLPWSSERRWTAPSYTPRLKDNGYAAVAQIAQKEAINKSLSSAYFARLNKYEEIYQEMGELATTQEGWDSYGAPAPNGNAIAEGQLILRELFEKDLLPDKINAVSEGGVGLLFKQFEKRAYIEVSNEGELSFGRYVQAESLQITDFVDSRNAAKLMLEYLEG